MIGTAYGYWFSHCAEKQILEVMRYDRLVATCTNVDEHSINDVFTDIVIQLCDATPAGVLH